MTARLLRWSGHDAEGNTVSGEVPVQVVHVCPVDPTDGRDVTAELTEWLNSLPSNVTADLGGKVYRSEKPIKLTGKTGLVIRNGTLTRTDRAGHGGVVYPAANPHLWLLYPVRCRVENLTVRGTNDVSDQRTGFGAYLRDYEFEAAIRLERFTDCAVVGLDCDGIWGDGVQWQKGSGAYVADSRIDRVGRQGVTLVGSNFLIERVRVEHGRRSGFDLEPDLPTEVCENFEIRNCYTNSIGLAYASAGRGQVNNVYIHHNIIDGPSVPVVYCASSDGSRRHHWRFEDNTALLSLGSPTPATRFDRVDHLSVKRNRMPIPTTAGRIAWGMTNCGGVCEFVDNDSRPGGDRYFNRTPMADQQVIISGNQPPLVTQIA